MVPYNWLQCVLGNPAIPFRKPRSLPRWILSQTPRLRLRQAVEIQTAALLIVGHGSTVNPDSSTPTWTHAREIQRRNIFADVRCAFWKEEPSLRDARFFFADRTIREVFVVPNFISEGYFTQTVIPRELELKGPVTTRANGQTWIYCEPVGNNPIVTELLLARAHEIAPDVEPTETALLIVAHGTELNDNSAIAAKREAERIRARGEFASVRQRLHGGTTIDRGLGPADDCRQM